MMKSATRAKVRKVLVAAGITIAKNKYDGDGVHFVDYVDFTGIALGAYGHSANNDEIRAALDAAGIAHEMHNMLVVPKALG